MAVLAMVVAAIVVIVAALSGCGHNSSGSGSSGHVVLYAIGKSRRVFYAPVNAR